MKFEYVRYDGTRDSCEIDVRRREGFTLVIASEEDGHKFGGIRDSVDKLATAVCRNFNISPQRLVWVEHNEYGEKFPDDWYLVTFGWDWPRGVMANSFRSPTTERHVTELLERDGAVALAIWKERMMQVRNEPLVHNVHQADVDLARNVPVAEVQAGAPMAAAVLARARRMDQF